jgi:serine protease Do
VRIFQTRWQRVFPYLLGFIFGITIALLVISIVMFKRVSQRSSFLPGSNSSFASEDIERERKGAIVEATRKVSGAVVSINALRSEMVYNKYRMFYRMFPTLRIPKYYREDYSITGSGMIVRSDGYILTNEHVVRNAEEIRVTLSDGREKIATVLGASVQDDLALLRVDAEELPYAVFGDSDELNIGEWVVAIGSPFGYLLNDTQPTVTVGVVSALNRDVKSNQRTGAIFKNMIQTDAAINPGNSGGPLVSGNGEVIGINTFVFSSDRDSNLGVGFAIPSNRARYIIDEIVTYGRVREVWTGLTVREITPETARAMGLSRESGLLVEVIKEGSPADKGGLKVGDIINRVNREEINTVNQANRAVHGLRVGDKLELEVTRGGRDIEVILELTEKPNQA